MIEIPQIRERNMNWDGYESNYDQLNVPNNFSEMQYYKMCKMKNL